MESLFEIKASANLTLNREGLIQAYVQVRIHYLLDLRPLEAVLLAAGVASTAVAVGAGAFFFAAGLRVRRGEPFTASTTSEACFATSFAATTTSSISFSIFSALTMDS